MRSVTNADIGDLIRDYRRAKMMVKDLRLEMVKVAVEQFHIPQDEAMNMSVDTFFDGYLTGRGIVPSYREPT